MLWITKNQLRIDVVRLQTQNEMMTVSLRQRDEYIAKLERLLDHERERIEAERSRADRAGDALLQQNGIAPISNLGVEISDAAREEAKKQMKDIAQIYAESLDDMDPDISPEVKAVIAGVPKEIN